jgi:hypothetical protein
MAWSDQITKGRWLRLGFRYPHPAKPFQGEMSDNEKLSEIVLAIATEAAADIYVFSVTREWMQDTRRYQRTRT